MPDIKVALLGYGYVGQTFHAPLIRHTDGLALHTVVSSQPDKVLADHPGVRVVADPEAAFADPDIDLVVIATPNATHAPLALQALRQGKHVVVDKPFTVTLADAEQVVATAADANRLLSVFHNRRWDADFLMLQSVLREARLGDISELHSHFDRHRPQVRDRWRERDEPGAGLWYDLGPHLLDQAVQLFGMPQAVQADIAIQRPAAQAPDYFHVVLRYPRLRVVLHAGSLVPHPAPRFAVHGNAGSFIKTGLDVQEGQLRAGQVPGTPGWGVEAQPGRLFHADGPEDVLPANTGDYRDYYRGMRDAIRGHGPLPATPAEALQVMRLITLGAESARLQRSLDV